MSLRVLNVQHGVLSYSRFVKGFQKHICLLCIYFVKGTEMPKHKRKFISKEEGITFHLVNRSQQDPLIADETAPQHVLVPQTSKKNKDEEDKYGIFFDDEYNYLQHLKSSAETNVEWERVEFKPNAKPIKNDMEAKIQLPSSVFASEVEEVVGMLNKAAPIHGLRLELDPDIVEALDDVDKYNKKHNLPKNSLEDDFVEQAMNEDLKKDSEEGSDDERKDEENDDFPSGGVQDFMEEETGTKFTNYSMTSSVMRRNEQLSLLDNHFEKLLKAYESSEIGALDGEEIEGFISQEKEILIKLAEEFKKGKTNDKLIIREKALAVTDEKSDEEEETEKIVMNDKGEKWDCESILSTYSNLYNHPAKIVEPKGPGKIKVSKKTGIPLGVIGANNLTAHNLSLLNQGGMTIGPRSVISQLSELSIRPKDESPEERRTRKINLKEYRRDRRMERKANTLAFKEEKLRQEKVLLNQRNNQQGIKVV